MHRHREARAVAVALERWRLPSEGAASASSLGGGRSRSSVGRSRSPEALLLRRWRRRRRHPRTRLLRSLRSGRSTSRVVRRSGRAAACALVHADEKRLLEGLTDVVRRARVRPQVLGQGGDRLLIADRWVGTVDRAVVRPVLDDLLGAARARRSGAHRDRREDDEDHRDQEPRYPSAGSCRRKAHSGVCPTLAGRRRDGRRPRRPYAPQEGRFPPSSSGGRSERIASEHTRDPAFGHISVSSLP